MRAERWNEGLLTGMSAELEAPPRAPRWGEPKFVEILDGSPESSTSVLGNHLSGKARDFPSVAKSELFPKGAHRLRAKHLIPL